MLDALAAAFLLLCLCAFSGTARAQTVFQVPGNFSTIQAAINAASNGDTVLVGPGVYVENINFLGKAITVKSALGANATVIDGNASGSVVTFANGESASSKLVGFTIRNGRADFGGGGINIRSSSPVIQDNIIIGNRATNGVGIAIDFASPLIQRNVIAANHQHGSGGIGGGGISIGGAAAAQVIGNVIAGNSPNGISLFAAGTPLVKDNVISGNLASQGGGMWIVNQSDASIVQNLIIGNSAVSGGGIYWGVPSGARGPFVVNNTIADNDAQQGSGIFADAFDAQARLSNNVIVAMPNQIALYCGDFNDLNPPIVESNIVFSPSGPAYGGICNNTTGSGNLSTDPMFADPSRSNYRLTAKSPAIDTGLNSAPELPSSDIEGNARVRDGDANGVASVDRGAYEFTSSPNALSVSVSASDFGTFVVGGAPSSVTATIANTGATSATVILAAVASANALEFAIALGGSTPCTSFSVTLAAGTSCTFIVSFTPTTPGVRKGTLVILADAVGSPVMTALTATVSQPDATPDPFSFVAQTNVARGTVATSNSVTVTGISGPIAISIAGGEYNINGGAFTASPGTITNGQSVVVRTTAPTSYATTTGAALTIGSFTANFSVSTADFHTVYFPLVPGQSWVVRRNGVVLPPTTVISTPPVNGASTLGMLDTSNGSIAYFSNDSLGVRLHQIFSPPSFIDGCGIVAETDTFTPPVTILAPGIGLGQTASSNGLAILIAESCGTFQVGYSAFSTMQAIERVSVPAGQFDALRVLLSVSIGGLTQSATIWFAPGIGEVKSVNSNGTVNELVSTNIVYTTPGDIVFAAQSSVPINTAVISNAATIIGISGAAPVSILGGEYSIDGGAFSNQPGAVSNGQSIRVRLSSSTLPLTTTSATLTVGGVSAIFSATTAVGVPGAPSGVSAVASIGAITVRFNPPSSNGGTAITFYTATCASSNGGTSGSNTAGPGAASIQVPGLTVGRSYTCTVSASNAVGTGQVSAPSNTVTPFTLAPILNLLLD